MTKRCVLCQLADREDGYSSCTTCRPLLDAAWRRLLDVLADRLLEERAAKEAA